MKSIKEKQMYVKWAKAMNQPVDASLLEEVEKYEKIQKEILESVRENSIRDLAEASTVAEKLVEKVQTEFPKPPTLDEVLNVLKEETNELVQSQAQQTIETSQSTPKPSTETLIDKAANHITKEVKLEEKADSFQQPDPTLVNKNLEAITKKLKFLEQAIGKIAAHGPGSGEVRFLRLDDVNYQSWQDRDRHKILKYEPNANPAYDGVTFGFLTGDQGEIYSLKFDSSSGYTSNANVAPGLVYYDPERDALEILQKDSTRTYVGLDNYIRFKNGTANTIARGSLVQFIGSDVIDKVPLGGLFTANIRAVPLYIMGVCATDCPPNVISRAMLLGELEDINASGNVSNESWVTGDLLWASPSEPGKLTRVRPTAPNVVVSVAAVMDNGATTGRLLVRPVIWPRLRAGDFYSTAQQLAPNTDFAHQVILSNTLFTSTVSLNNNSVSVGESGLYKFDLRVQIASSSANQKSLVVWYKKNDINIPFSSVRQSVATNGGYATIVNNQMISLTPQDNVKVFFAVTDTTLYIDSPPIIDNSPTVPSVQLTVTEPSL